MNQVTKKRVPILSDRSQSAQGHQTSLKDRRFTKSAFSQATLSKFLRCAFRDTEYVVCLLLSFVAAVSFDIIYYDL